MYYNIYSKEQIKGTVWIEFNVSGSFKKIESRNAESKYISENDYNLFADIFEKNCDKFNYYGLSSFNLGQMNNIKEEIKLRHLYLKELNSINEIILFYEKNSGGYFFENQFNDAFKFRKYKIEKLKEDIINLGKNILSLLEYCISSEKQLQIFGL